MEQSHAQVAGGQTFAHQVNLVVDGDPASKVVIACLAGSIPDTTYNDDWKGCPNGLVKSSTICVAAPTDPVDAGAHVLARLD